MLGNHTSYECFIKFDITDMFTVCHLSYFSMMCVILCTEKEIAIQTLLLWAVKGQNGSRLPNKIYLSLFLTEILFTSLKQYFIFFGQMSVINRDFSDSKQTHSVLGIWDTNRGYEKLNKFAQFINSGRKQNRSFEHYESCPRKSCTFFIIQDEAVGITWNLYDLYIYIS